MGNDGNFYGTTRLGGYPLISTYGFGTIFRLTTNGTLTVLYSFTDGNDGGSPEAALTVGEDGNFYGTTVNGTYDGTIFKVTTNGALTPLVVFGVSIGEYPEAALAIGPDGNFYGTTFGGGSGGDGTPPYAGVSGCGTIFQLMTNGTLNTLVSFNNGNGEYPTAGLTLGTDGNFYGTTSQGGDANDGTIFKMTTNGHLATLLSFNGSNGCYPMAGLTLGNDGNFYGTTAGGGTANDGTIFQVTTNGNLSTLVSFNGTNGEQPESSLTLGNDGNFYGTTYYGGSGNAGTVFRLLIPPFINIQPQSQTNSAGSTVTFVVIANNPASTVYQWQKNDISLVNTGNISGATTKALTITGISDADAGSYCLIASNANGSVTTSNATLTVVDPISITAQPTNLLVLAGTNATFGVSLTGSTPLFYQWFLNSTNLLNSTNATYTIPSVGPINAGNYSVVVSNWAGSVTTSNASLTVVLSPISQTSYASSTATFTAPSFGPASMNYQWQRNATNLPNSGRISGATNTTLTIAEVSDADAGIYNAVVSDAVAAVATSNATLAVIDTLFDVSDPQSQTVLQGSNVTFNFTVYGAPPFLFQWYFNFSGSPLSSIGTQTNVGSITLTNVGVSQAGYYQAEAVNADGSLWSESRLPHGNCPTEVEPASGFRLSAAEPRWHVGLQLRCPIQHECGGHKLGKSAFCDQFAVEPLSVP